MAEEEKKKRLTRRSLPADLKLAVEAGLDKKAEGVCVLDLRELCSFTDFFLIAQGNSSRQNAAISDEIEARLKAAGSRPLRVEGRAAGEWVLMDYGDFLVHVFSPKSREFYSLEKLWGDAPRLDLQ